MQNIQWKKHEYSHFYNLIQNTFVDTSNYLQLCFAKLPVCCIIVKANSKLMNKFAVSMIVLLTFF